MKRRAEKLLRPIVQGRLDMIEAHDGDWPEKPVRIPTTPWPAERIDILCPFALE